MFSNVGCLFIYFIYCRKRKCAGNVKAGRKKRLDDKEVPATNVAAKGARRKTVKLVSVVCSTSQVFVSTVLTFLNFFRKDSRKGGKEQVRGVMKTKRPARNVGKAVGIRGVKLACAAMKRKSVKLVFFVFMSNVHAQIFFAILLTNVGSCRKAKVKSRQDV